MIRLRRRTLEVRETRLAWVLMTPTLALLAVMALGPLVATIWESLFSHDLRLPWLGRTYIGLGNYTEAASDARFRQALAHTVGFTVTTVAIEFVLGLLLALMLDALLRFRGLARVLVLLPWALPTVVAALIWRLMFADQGAPAAGLLDRIVAGSSRVDWLAGPQSAWVPIVLAEVWKTTPFMVVRREPRGPGHIRFYRITAVRRRVGRVRRPGGARRKRRPGDRAQGGIVVRRCGGY